MAELRPRAQLDIGELSVGDAMPERRVGPIRQEHLVRYAGASGDFNPFHFDAELARSRGFKDVFAQGLFTAGILGETLRAWAGPEMLRKLKFRFKEPVWLGDELTFRAVVTEIHADDHGRRRAELECRVVAADGREVLSGSATLGEPPRPDQRTT